jgi:hypothetical protein
MSDSLAPESIAMIDGIGLRALAGEVFDRREQAKPDPIWCTSRSENKAALWLLRAAVKADGPVHFRICQPSFR